MNIKISIPKILMIGFLIFSDCFSQFTEVGSEIRTPIYPSAFTKIGAENWGSGGAIITDKNISIGGINNPAVIYSNNISFYFEFGLRPATKWMNIFEWDGQLILPAYFSIRLPYNKWNFEFGYNNLYNLWMRAKLTARTQYNPQGPPKYFNINWKAQTHTIFGATNFQVNENISLGFTTGLNYFKHDEEFGYLSVDGQDYGTYFNFGVLYSPDERLKIGSTYKIITDINYDIVLGIISKNPDSTVINHVQSENSLNNKYVSKFPSTFEIGLSYNLNPTVILHGKVEIQMWPEKSIIRENITNVHLGLELLASESNTLRIGFFTIGNKEYSNGDAILNQYFLTFGLSYQINPNLKVSASVLDSHLFNNKDFEDHFGKGGEQFHQTHLSAGISYSL